MEGKNVLLVGAWHLGSVIGACIADAGHTVALWDQREAVAGKWRNGLSPIFEPGLEALAARHWSTRLFWANDVEAKAREADWILFAYDTPIDERDEIRLDEVDAGLVRILESRFHPRANFLFASQLPVGTCRLYRSRIAQASPDWNGHLLYYPENLRLGDAIATFRAPDRFVLGIDSESTAVRSTLESGFRQLTGIPDAPADVMSLESAEMVKHALNTFLAACVVFGNEVAEVCERSGADAWSVLSSLRRDQRVGAKSPLLPGLAFAGGTLARDVKTMMRLHEGPAAENLFSRLYAINENRNRWVVRALKARLGEELRGRRIALLGVTYKPGTSTVRRSPAVSIGALLRDEGALCTALDPRADLTELSAAERETLPFEMASGPEAAFQDADACVLITEWPQFLELDWPALRSLMRSPLLIDTKHFLSRATEKLGLELVIPGKPAANLEMR